MRAFLKVLRPGALSSIQDLGVKMGGLLALSPSGVMDPLALMYGNLIVGNPKDSAGIEITMLGPKLEVQSVGFICLIGSPFGFKINDKEQNLGKAILVGPGDIIDIGSAKTGLRSYLCIAGGISGNELEGSLSSHLTVSSLNKGALKKDSIIYIKEYKDGSINNSIKVPELMAKEISAIEGPQSELFSQEELTAFWNNPHTVSNEQNRKGIRITESIGTSLKKEMISEGTTRGSVQITNSGNPIILANEQWTTGGYPKIATIISADLGKLAHLRPGDKITFKKVSLDEAFHVYNKQLEELKKWQQ